MQQDLIVDQIAEAFGLLIENLGHEKRRQVEHLGMKPNEVKVYDGIIEAVERTRQNLLGLNG